MHTLLVSLLASLPARHRVAEAPSPNRVATACRTIRAATAAWTIRAVRPSDAPAMRAFVDGLSATSRRLRFHGAVGRCSERMAAALVACDATAGGAVFAAFVDDAEGGTPRLVGEARWVPRRDDDARAELALAVADDWQGRGLAAALLAVVQTSARVAGVRSLLADVLAENPRMPRLLEREGYSRNACEGGRLVFERSLAKAPAVARRLRDALAAITQIGSLVSLATLGSIRSLGSIALPPDADIAGPHDGAPSFA